MRYALAVVLALATGLSGQEMMPGTARPLLENMPATTSGFICPMHPNEVKADARHLQHLRHDARAGRSDGDRRLPLRVTTEPRAVKAGQKTQVPHRDPHPLTGEPVTQFARSPRQALPSLHRQPRHDAVLSRAPGAREGRLVHDRARHPDGRALHAVQRLHAGRRRTADDRDARSSTAGFEGDIASSWPNLKPDTSFVKSRERRDGRLADRAGEGHRRRRSRRADSFRG